MSAANVELVRRVYAFLAETGDFPYGLFAPDAEFDVTDVMPDMGVMRRDDPEAHPEAALQTYSGMFEDFRIDLERVVVADEEHVVTTVRDGGRLRGSGAEITNRFHHGWTVRGGRIVRWSSHLTVERALEAVGLDQ